MKNRMKLGIIAIAILAIAMLGVPAMACPPNQCGDHHPGACPDGLVCVVTGQDCDQVAAYGTCHECPTVNTSHWGNYGSCQSCPKDTYWHANGYHDENACHNDEHSYSTCNGQIYVCHTGDPAYSTSGCWSNKEKQRDWIVSFVYQCHTQAAPGQDGYVHCDRQYHERTVTYNEVCTDNYGCQNCPEGQQPNEDHTACVGIPGYCTLNSDCTDNQVCTANSCTDLVCNSGYHAVGHECVPDGTCPVTPCDENQVCDIEQGTCSACGDNMHVVDNACVCNVGFHDYEGQCIPDTSCVDVQCEPGYHCVDGQCTPDGTCPVTPCPDGYHCVDGQCAINTCPEDFQCGEGEKCVGGQCIGVCSDIQCDSGYECVGGECVPDGTCPVTPCGPSQNCIGGQCITPFTPPVSLDFIEQYGDQRLSNAGFAAGLAMAGAPEMMGQGSGTQKGFIADVDNGASGSRYVRVHDTCPTRNFYIRVVSQTNIHDFQIYYYTARDDDGVWFKYGQVVPYGNNPILEVLLGSGTLTAHNPNTAIHAYAKMQTNDKNTHQGLGFVMQFIDSKTGNILWQGSNNGKRDMSVIFLLDPYEKCVPYTDVVAGITNFRSWVGLPGKPIGSIL